MQRENSLSRPAVRCVLALLLSSLLSPVLQAEKVEDLKPQGYVSDFAGVLSPPARGRITAICVEADQKAGAQIAVVTIKSLEGAAIELFSIDLATRWGIGPRGKHRGVLILLAPNDHKYRVEVGYGLEPILPDGKVGGFGREMAPLLRQNNFDGALLLLTERIASVIAQDRGITLESLGGLPPKPEESPGTPLFGPLGILLLFVLIAFLFRVITFFLRMFFGWPRSAYRRRGGFWWLGGGPWYSGGWGGGGSWGGGGFGGGGGGFGGFGGGSFGGGGASGSW